jgi:hypothetical protein
MARPAVVVEAGDLTCKEQGKRLLAGLTASTVKLTVSTSPVIPMQSVIGAAPYLGCTLPQPCATTVVTSSGAAKLTVGGLPVLLDSDKVSSESGTVTVHPAQSKLTAS